MIYSWKCCICLNMFNNQSPRIECIRCNEGKLCDNCVSQSLSHPNRLRFISFCNICNQTIPLEQLHFIQPQIRNGNHEYYKKIESFTIHIFVIPFLYESILYTTLVSAFDLHECCYPRENILDFCIYDFLFMLLFDIICFFYFACRSNDYIPLLFKTKLILYIPNSIFFFIVSYFSKDVCKDYFFTFTIIFHFFSHITFFLSHSAYHNQNYL